MEILTNAMFCFAKMGVGGLSSLNFELLNI